MWIYDVNEFMLLFLVVLRFGVKFVMCFIFVFIIFFFRCVLRLLKYDKMVEDFILWKLS